MADNVISDLRDALQECIGNAIDELHAYDVQKGQERMDCALIFPRPSPSGFFEVTNNTRKYFFVVEVHALIRGTTQPFARAQDRLDGYVAPTGDRSIQAAIANNQTLSGAAKLAVAGSFIDYGKSKLDNKDTLMALIPVEVTV